MGSYHLFRCKVPSVYRGLSMYYYCPRIIIVYVLLPPVYYCKNNTCRFIIPSATQPPAEFFLTPQAQARYLHFSISPRQQPRHVTATRRHPVVRCRAARRSVTHRAAPIATRFQFLVPSPDTRPATPTTNILILGPPAQFPSPNRSSQQRVSLETRHSRARIHATPNKRTPN
ncbi:hypothetical protein NEOLEDRAFT_546784 [Neolentinus lepideus HHB14362 ss-1]|uniref:Uncharacterized protein n=1 Tax=Neolentinus lepideus HHB14362 ss-1 TaxID=1314782 RepID=A0A165R8Q2_9AGAM|nr:hypothetical protein NEOLEDRAFT_546784 [Neolentinus lepideus HHB14362 ss-1]